MITAFFIVTLISYFFSTYKDHRTIYNPAPFDFWFVARCLSCLLAIGAFLGILIFFSIVVLGTEIFTPKSVIIAKWLLYFGK